MKRIQDFLSFLIPIVASLLVLYVEKPRTINALVSYVETFGWFWCFLMSCFIYIETKKNICIFSILVSGLHTYLVSVWLYEGYETTNTFDTVWGLADIMTSTLIIFLLKNYQCHGRESDE